MGNPPCKNSDSANGRGIVNGFLTKEASRYGLTRDSAVFLDQRSPAYLGGALKFLNRPKTMETYQHLTEIVR